MSTYCWVNGCTFHSAPPANQPKRFHSAPPANQPKRINHLSTVVTPNNICKDEHSYSIFFFSNKLRSKQRRLTNRRSSGCGYTHVVQCNNSLLEQCWL